MGEKETGPTGQDHRVLVEMLVRLEGHRRSTDQLQHAIVGMMRRYGYTWEAIGEELGISRQAAQKRFSQQRHHR